jgi:rhodanese-related sulfurtransferase
MHTINRKQLKNRLEHGDRLTLILAGDARTYEQAHIPGSVPFTGAETMRKLDPNQEVVVYCTNSVCYTSYTLVQYLLKHGYKNVSRYPGGLEEWDAAGYPLEGRMVS